ncbi:MAG: R3H domain-containing nucleic acid-binding protein [Vulcanimicrobiota bacterium]
MFDGEIRITDDLDKLLGILPERLSRELEKQDDLIDLIEIVMDLGRKPEARFEDKILYLSDEFITRGDIEHVKKNIGKFGDDNRAGIERTLHRISAIRNRMKDIIGFTMRVGRAVYGTIQIIRDLMETEQSILLLGRPGIGKTTMLREFARVLADDFEKRVVVVDTSNEIAGDGDIPHPGIGAARRMQVSKHDLQHEVMIEAVQNHMPEVIVVDEIGTEREAYAARTIAERGVQLIATAHGNSLENLLMNPTLSDLIGGIQSVTLSDEVARKRGTQKTVLERKAPPTFDIVVEIKEKDKVAIHKQVDKVVDLMLRGIEPDPEMRVRDDEGFTITQTSSLEEAIEMEKPVAKPEKKQMFALPQKRPIPERKRPVRIFPYAVSKNRIEKAIESMNVKAEVVKRFEEADVILTIKSQLQRGPKKLREIAGTNVPIHAIRSNTVTQVKNFLREFFNVPFEDVDYSNLNQLDINENDLKKNEKVALKEAENAIQEVIKTAEPVELKPQNSYVRRLQHNYIEKHNLTSVSMGKEPFRRIRIYNEKIF